MYKCVYFGTKELVSPIVYNMWGEMSRMFIDDLVKEDLDFVRESYGFQIVINDWSWGGNLKQCGLRSNLDPMVMQKTNDGKLYLSAHTMGKGFDLHCGMNHNKKLWEHCHQLLLHNKLKAFKSIESLELTKGWVHLDTFKRSSIIFK